MKNTTSTALSEPTEAEIQKKAYYLWLESGKPEGRDLEHWDAAREILRHSARLHDGHRPRKTMVPAFVATGDLNAGRRQKSRAPFVRGTLVN